MNLPHCVIIGGGIAGASLAYFLGRLPVAVTLIDAQQDTASHVPAALINPVRGQSGQVSPQMIAGMRRTWSLIAELRAQGLSVPAVQSGLLRPVPNEKTYAKFCQHLPPVTDLPHEWRAGTGGAYRVLHLPEGGWVNGAALIAALKQAAQQQGATLLTSCALAWDAHTVHTEQGSVRADAVVFCGGSLGATWRSGAQPESAQETHRMGSLLLLSEVPEMPVSFGAYVSRMHMQQAGGVLGATFETPSTKHEALHLPLRSLLWLLEKGSALTDLSTSRVTGHWTGVRLSGLRVGQCVAGDWELLGLGSKGFLLGPLLAEALAVQVQQSLRA